jgi:hypothetical protein
LIGLDELRVYFLVFVSVVALFVASPALGRLLVYPRTEFFTELWLLGPSHRAEGYPFNVSVGMNYTVFLGVSNRLGHCGYYVVTVKFRNESQPGPASFGPEGTRVPSNVSSLFNMSVFVGDQQVLEQPVTFSFTYTYDDVAKLLDLSSMTFNDAVLNMTGYTVAKSANATDYAGHLFFETWLYRNETQGFTYHERFVSLRLNMTT